MYSSVFFAAGIAHNQKSHFRMEKIDRSIEQKFESRSDQRTLSLELANTVKCLYFSVLYMSISVRKVEVFLY